jgi:hydroxymethylpyrimidine kinase/phosphomethylpyrimidine kinase/thiamine-phosphate diphosphorylase
MKIIVALGGTDSSGAAGLTADIRAIEAVGFHAATIVSTVTAQNAQRVLDVHPLDAQLVDRQLTAVLEPDGGDQADSVVALKSGLLGSSELIGVLANHLDRRSHLPYLLDPVTHASSGARLLPKNAITDLIDRLVPRATLITPNAVEAAVLSGKPVHDAEEAGRAGELLIAHGARAVLVKGGHLQYDRGVDVLVHGRGCVRFAALPSGRPNGDALPTRGTGCSLASFITAALALNATLEEAIAWARSRLAWARPLSDSRPDGASADHVMSADPSYQHFLPRPDGFRLAPLGRLHVLTDEAMGPPGRSHEALCAQALRGGADVIQLREKRLRSSRPLLECASTLARTCHEFGRLLIVDDRCDLVRFAGAHGVHLGQHDLPPHAARQLLGPLALIGATANSLEQAREHRTSPIDYLGVGPVFGTHSKENPAPPMGLKLLAQIAAESPVPVIAIGNISAERIPSVIHAGAYGVAVLSAVAQASDVAAATRACRVALDRALETKRQGAHEQGARL